MIRRAVCYVSDIVTGAKKACPQISFAAAKGFSKILDVLKQKNYVRDYSFEDRRYKVKPGEIAGYCRNKWTHGLALGHKKLAELNLTLTRKYKGVLIFTAPGGLRVFDPKEVTGGIPLVYVY